MHKKALQLTSDHVSDIILGIQGFKNKQHFELSLEMINNCLKKKERCQILRVQLKLKQLYFSLGEFFKDCHRTVHSNKCE